MKSFFFAVLSIVCIWVCAMAAVIMTWAACINDWESGVYAALVFIFSLASAYFAELET